MDRGDLQIEYVEARRVLLDALTALTGQLDAVVLVGAQAVYLRTEGRLTTYQPYTTDADIVLDPTRLSDRPAIGAAMAAAGFELGENPGVWEARFRRDESGAEVVVPVDLIVPMAIASSAGRRSARLGGEHGKRTAQKSRGLEGALVDASPIQIAALDANDTRSLAINVAGEAALLVAKLHKLGDRLDEPRRLEAKDAGDVYRLFDSLPSDTMVERIRLLLNDDRSAEVATAALRYGDTLFDSPTSTGVTLGVEALRAAMPAATVTAVLTSYWQSIRVDLG